MNPPLPQVRPVKEKRTPKPLKRGPGPKRKKPPNKKRKTSRGKMGRLADKLFSLIVRASGRCFVTGSIVPLAFVDHVCRGSLQCAHIVSRRYRSTRWSEDNAVALCAGAHRFFTGRQIEWDAFVEQNVMPAGDYATLKRRALERWDGDLEGVLVRLAARAVSMGIEAK